MMSRSEPLWKSGYLEHETSSYSLHSDPFGNFLLHRRADGAECYFQGDDARLWRDNIDAIIKIDQSATGWGPQQQP